MCRKFTFKNRQSYVERSKTLCSFIIIKEVEGRLILIFHHLYKVLTFLPHRTSKSPPFFSDRGSQVGFFPRFWVTCCSLSFQTIKSNILWSSLIFIFFIFFLPLHRSYLSSTIIIILVN